VALVVAAAVGITAPESNDRMEERVAAVEKRLVRQEAELGALRKQLNVLSSDRV
jgi:hypothetical protein